MTLLFFKVFYAIVDTFWHTVKPIFVVAFIYVENFRPLTRSQNEWNNFNYFIIIRNLKQKRINIGNDYKVVSNIKNKTIYNEIVFATIFRQYGCKNIFFVNLFVVYLEIQQHKQVQSCHM